MERINTKLKFAVFLMLTFILSGCGTMPTPPAQIAGFYVPGMKYEQYDCQSLSIEMSHLERLERQLIIAQQQRIKNSEMQVAWGSGFHLGDGLEAFELANVRGEKEAVRRFMAVKGCQ
ncbi:hypothetical protein ES705_11637 [subsurface metagenome]